MVGLDEGSNVVMCDRIFELVLEWGLVFAIVDPDLISLIFSLTVKYDSRKTTKASGVIAANGIDTIQSYKTNSLNKFGSIFRYSVLSKQVDVTDTDVTVTKGESKVTASKTNK